jgi:hypothetical protein
MIERLFKAHAHHGRAETNKGMDAGLEMLLQAIVGIGPWRYTAIVGIGPRDAPPG